jgi:hypothetical protein
MPRLRLRLQITLALLGLSAAAAASVSAQQTQTTTVVRRSGSSVTASMFTSGECIQRYLDISAESSVEKTRVDGTRSVGEIMRTLVDLQEVDLCTGVRISARVELPNLDGTSWDTAQGTASMSFSRTVDVLQCSDGAEGFQCETHSELLTLNVQWTGNGDFQDTVYVGRQTIDGTFRTERSRGKSMTMDVLANVQLGGAAKSFVSGFGTLLKNRSGTLTIGSL